MILPLRAETPSSAFILIDLETILSVFYRSASLSGKSQSDQKRAPGPKLGLNMPSIKQHTTTTRHAPLLDDRDVYFFGISTPADRGAGLDLVKGFEERMEAKLMRDKLSIPGRVCCRAAETNASGLGIALPHLDLMSRLELDVILLCYACVQVTFLDEAVRHSTSPVRGAEFSAQVVEMLAIAIKTQGIECH